MVWVKRAEEDSYKPSSEQDGVWGSGFLQTSWGGTPQAEREEGPVQGPPILDETDGEGGRGPGFVLQCPPLALGVSLLGPSGGSTGFYVTCLPEKWSFLLVEEPSKTQAYFTQSSHQSHINHYDWVCSPFPSTMNNTVINICVGFNFCFAFLKKVISLGQIP